jgi:uncharacterized protein (TIGR03435 family)
MERVTKWLRQVYRVNPSRPVCERRHSLNDASTENLLSDCGATARHPNCYDLAMLELTIRRTRRIAAITIFAAACLAIAVAQAQTSSAVRPKFEVASIKLDKTCDGRVGHDTPPVVSPGRLQLNCLSLERLIQFAYVSFANGVRFSRQVLEITGGPNWIRSNQYDLVAKAETNAGVAQMSGPMLQTLLEDRFQLRIHRATKEGEVYTLTIAKNGPKLEPAKEGGCTPRDLDRFPVLVAPGQPRPIFCDEVMELGDRRVEMLEGHGMKMTEFAQGLVFEGVLLDRPVIDKTGFTGVFDFYLRFAQVDSGDGGGKGGGRGNPNPGPVESSEPSIFEVLEKQLGLKLVAEKGLVEFLVIDHVEKPSEN